MLYVRVKGEVEEMLIKVVEEILLLMVLLVRIGGVDVVGYEVMVKYGFERIFMYRVLGMIFMFVLKVLYGKMYMLMIMLGDVCI